MELSINDFLEEEYPITASDLVSAIHPSLPDVLATYTIVKWAEITSAKLLMPHLNDNQLSLGIRVDIKHTGVSLLNDSLKITSTVSALKGGMVSFEIIAEDKSEVVAKIKHIRIITDKNNLDDKMQLKM